MDFVKRRAPPVGGSCSPPADFDGGGSVRMARRAVQSKIHRRLRATPDRLHVLVWRTPPGVRMDLVKRRAPRACVAHASRRAHGFRQTTGAACRGIVLAAGGFRRWRLGPHGTSCGAVEDSPAAARDPRPAPRACVAHASRRAHGSRQTTGATCLCGARLQACAWTRRLTRWVPWRSPREAPSAVGSRPPPAEWCVPRRSRRTGCEATRRSPARRARVRSHRL